MTNSEAVNWIINISADIGKAEHCDLWHYEQALSEIREMLESAQPYTEAEIQKMQDLEQAELDKAFELGKEEGRKEVQQWIPCSKTTDIPDHEIMACDEYGEIMFGYLAYEDDQWICASDGYEMVDPIAWREKPEPYREESD